MFEHPLPLLKRLKLALEEDVGSGDVTTERVAPPGARARAELRAKESGVFSGGYVFPLLLAASGADVDPCCMDSCSPAEWVNAVRKILSRARNKKGPKTDVAFLTACPGPAEAGDRLMAIEGPARILLTAERVGLNLISRLSGVATLTRAFVDACRPRRPEILCTRKTTPLWRDLEKLAVKDGGGKSHRQGLYDMILIKDNHLAAVGGDIRLAMKKARKGKRLPIELEVETLEQFRQALDAAPDYILLDNMSPEQMTKAAFLCRKRFPTGKKPLLEASGNVNLANVRSVAAAGVDRISIGSLTHSVKSLDLALDLKLL